MRPLLRPALAVAALAALTPCALALVTAGSPASATPGGNPGPDGWGGSGLTARTVLAGASLTHDFTVAGTSMTSSEPLSSPDDITHLGQDIFVGFQNGVGPQGQASPSGNLDSTVVELTPSGQPLAQWDIMGKADGVTATPKTGTVIATVNEDANSSLYAITPGPGGGVQHYAYNEPLPHNGGTDAISVWNGRLYIGASAPGTTGTMAASQPTFPAVYAVTLDAADSVATVSPLFDDEDPAVVANVGTPQSGHVVNLALTDPDSNEIVPPDGPRFAGDFMLTSQGDQQQIFVSHTRPPALRRQPHAVGRRHGVAGRGPRDFLRHRLHQRHDRRRDRGLPRWTRGGSDAVRRQQRTGDVPCATGVSRQLSRLAQPVDGTGHGADGGRRAVRAQGGLLFAGDRDQWSQQ